MVSQLTKTWANQVAAPNRRLRLGLVPWSFEALTSQDSAVGELDRSAYVPCTQPIE